MKKLATLLAAFIMAFTFAASAQAQSFSWGITGGLNMT